MKETSSEGAFNCVLIVLVPPQAHSCRNLKYLTAYSHVVGQVCLKSRSVRLPPTLVTADNLVPSLMHLGCCRALTTQSVYAGNNGELLHTDAISEGEHIRAHSSHVNILTLSLRQIHTHASRLFLFFALWYRGMLSSSRKQTFLCVPASPLRSMCVFILNFAWLLI